MDPTTGSSENKRLNGRTALISGGAQGIGRAIAESYQAEGASVVILDCDLTTGADTARELTERCRQRPVSFLAADLRKPEEVAAAVKQLARDHAAVDILVNNAGIELDRAFEDLSIQDWDCILGVNLRGAFLLTKAVLPLFPERGGAIVNISSIHSTHAFPNSLPYACSKAALVAFTRNLALELGPRHIRVNAICPGYIDTRLWDEYVLHAADPQQLAEETAALHPVGRRGQPADVAEAALFLASDASAFITGTNLVVDGGLTVRAHP